MTRFAAVDRQSGFVWGVADALEPMVAAVAICEAADDSRRYAAELVNRWDADASFDVYEVPAALVIEDGQDPATIAAVVASAYVCTVTMHDADRTVSGR